MEAVLSVFISNYSLPNGMTTPTDADNRGSRSLEKRKYFSIVQPNENFRGMTYSDLMQDYYNWIYSADPDVRKDLDITFLRGNAFGRYDPPKERILHSSPEILTHPNFVLDRTGLRRSYSITTNTALFINVFDSIFFVSDDYLDNKLRTHYECRLAARQEFKLASSVWAIFERLGDENDDDEEVGKNEGERKPIVQNLDEYYVESSPMKVYVSDKNKLTREPDYTLEGGVYEGVAAGVFLLITDFVPGWYRIDFGGTQRINYFTRAVYDIRVFESQATRIPDKSDKMIDWPFPPRDLVPDSPKNGQRNEGRKADAAVTNIGPSRRRGRKIS